ncbi:MAG: peptide chain release factor-like protein [Fibrobacteres bacterium]|nr:peptide chain release factor-like protein [Fibrobacterota bacterium]
MEPIEIPESDDDLLDECEVQVFRSSGPGGQHANKTESAVRIRHVPSGVVAQCQEERSQHLNKLRCLAKLRERIQERNHRDPLRIPTKPTGGSRRRGKIAKSRHSTRKSERSFRNWDPD